MTATVDLPHGTSPRLALVHPTDEEKLVQFKLNGAVWRGALNPDAYIRREHVLANQQLTRDGGITYWTLVDTEKHNALDPESKARLPLASCESYRRRALVWQDGKLQETVCHSIGSVFCAPHLRKRGYAARLMKEVGKALRTHQTEDRPCLFSVLYSDIGKEFYASFGWEPFHSSHISIPGVPSAIDGLPLAQPLHEEDLEELCTTDEGLIRQSLESRSKDSKIAVALIPDIATIRWYHAREDFVGKELHGKVPKIKGAIVGSERGRRVWCYWTRMWYNQDPNETRENTLHILRLVVEDENQRDVVDAIAALLSMAQMEAQEWKMEDVEAWSPSPAVVAAAQKLHPPAQVIERDMESLCCLQWYPQHEGRAVDKIDWLVKEKHGWC